MLIVCVVREKERKLTVYLRPAVDQYISNPASFTWKIVVYQNLFSGATTQPVGCPELSGVGRGGTQGHGLVGVVVMGWQLNLMICVECQDDKTRGKALSCIREVQVRY